MNKNSKKRDVIVNYNGRQFLTDVWMGERMRNNRYEVEEIKLLTQIPSDRELRVLELGGCLGVTSVLCNEMLLDPTKHVVIEANPKLIKYLEYNKKINNCSFSIKNNLISKNSDGVFYSYDKLVAGSAHRLDNMETNKTMHIIPVKTLEELQSEVGYEFNFLIIDIEGGELEFFKSFDISGFEYILVETHEFLMYKGFESEVFDVLNKNGFKVLNSIGSSSLLIKNNG